MALTPVVKVSEISATFEPIGEFGVSCEGAVGSVLYLGRIALRDALRFAVPIHMTGESETSRRLFGELCKQTYSLTPNLDADQETAQAKVVIGDEALRARQDHDSWPYQVDLCEWWHQVTGLPFIFARWMVRSQLPSSTKNAAYDWLKACVEVAGEPATRQRISEQAWKSGLFQSIESAQSYFASIANQFMPRALLGERAFLRRLEIM